MLCIYILIVILTAYLLFKAVLKRNGGTILVEDILPMIFGSIVFPAGIILSYILLIDRTKVIYREKK